MLTLEMVIKPRLARRVWRKLRFRDKRGAGVAAHPPAQRRRGSPLIAAQASVKWAFREQEELQALYHSALAAPVCSGCRDEAPGAAWFEQRKFIVSQSRRLEF